MRYFHRKKFCSHGSHVATIIYGAIKIAHEEWRFLLCFSFTKLMEKLLVCLRKCVSYLIYCN